MNVEYLPCSESSPEEPVFAFASRLREETFCCFCGDTFLRSEQIADLLRAHQASGADATILPEGDGSDSPQRVANLGPCVNINSPADLARAEQLVASSASPPAHPALGSS